MDKIGLIDFKGQRLATQATHTMLYSSAVVSFILGLFAQNVHLTLITFLAGVLLTFAVVVPPWPFMKTEPVVWLENQSKKAYAEAVRKLQEELDNENKT